MEWSTSTTNLAVLVPLTILSVDLIRRLILDRVERKGYPLPPGPTSLPFLGSALSVNFEEPFRTYTEWRGKYGDIMYIRLLDMDIVVLNSPSIATELLEKRSRIYSDRPFISTLESHGHDSNFALARYDEHWRLCRRIFHQTFRADTVSNHYSLQLHEARQLILNLMDKPNDYTSHFSTYTATMTMRSVYGYDSSARNDEIIPTIYKFLEASVPSLMPEKAVLFKVFPFLLHIPNWLPFSGFQREAKEARELGFRIVEEPYEYVKKCMESRENFSPSMVSENITQMEQFMEPYRSEYEKALKHTAATIFMASVETTSSALQTFTLAMVKYPLVLKRAQADIDAVVGTDRLPEFYDRPSLPYLDAILRETLRWQPAVPLGGPHATMTSDIYNGFYIPKGATVFANVWGMSRDEGRYPNAEAFIPERFLDAQGMLTDDIPDFVFGFGRRMCPGRHNVNASLWIAMATMLATLDFGPAKDADDKDITFEPKFFNGITRHLAPFPCHLAPRPHTCKASLEQVLAKQSI